MKLWELDEMIRALCPIDGIDSDGVISFRADATDAQRADAEALMAVHLADLE